MLSWLTKAQVRSFARADWIRAGCNPSLAEEYFRDRYEDASEELTNEAVAFAYEYWQHWIDTNQSEPSVICTADEPMGFED